MNKRHYVLAVFVTLFMLMFGITVFAAGYSSAWYQENGNWKVKGPDGQALRNCWFCDDAVFENGKNIWYLLDANGNMVSNPLVRDNRGNYYSLETSHDGIYGSLRYLDGAYDEVNMRFSKEHDGTFGALTNRKAIEALDDMYGTTDISIDSNNCYYSSSWLGTSEDPAKKAPSGLGPNGEGETTPDNATRTITYWLGNQRLGTDTGNTRYFILKRFNIDGFVCWMQNADMTEYQPGDMFYFPGNQTGANFYAVTEY